MSPLDTSPALPLPLPHTPVTLNGVRLAALACGGLWWPERRTLVVADLHLEKGSAIAQGTGQLLPPYDSRATLACLAQTVEAIDPARVLCLGDSFHDAEGHVRLSAAERRTLASLMAGRTWLWIVGNHDPEPPAGIGGETVADLVEGALVFRHEAVPGAAGEVSGHYHPKARVATRARRISARCFVEDTRRLVLPAYGAYAGGLDVLDPAIARLFERRFQVHLLGQRGLYTFPRGRLSSIA